MTDADKLDDETRILRVKRKRNDDPVDAFLFQFPIPPKAKRRGNSVKATQEQGVFRRKETLDTIPQSISQEKKHVIEAEWDATAQRVKLKRKHEEEEKPSSSLSHTRARIDEASEEGMEKFSKLLADYLDLNQVSLEGPHETKSESPHDYVYDIYYQEFLPKKLRISSEKETSSKNKPPVIGRASSKRNVTNHFSPVPIVPGRYAWDHSTSAPGFEHLFQDKGHMDRDLEWENEASFFPVHLRTTVDADGHISMVAVPIGGHSLAEHDLLLEELDDEDAHEEDEDSNDEDYYTNEYPEKDEWDIESGSESDV